MIGMRLQDLLGEELFARGEPFIRGALRGEPQRFERTLVKADGTTGYTWAQFIPYLDGAGEHGFLALLSDIGEVKQAQFALERANAELTARTVQAEEASAAKTRFLSSVSHELRTPLHTILGYVRLLLKETGGETRRQLAIVGRSGAQLLKLIDDLLEFNQETGASEALQADAVALRELARQLEHTGHLMARQGGNALSVTLADGLPAAVWADEQRLLQVLQNLLGNACKYTRNGTVALRITGESRAASDDVGVVGEAPGYRGNTGEDALCRLCFSVEDSGPGIAPQDLDRIFDVFNRGASARGQPGLGLGLAIARQWVRAMGGELQVRSTPGRGSQFFFTLELPAASMRPYTPESACDAFREVLAATPRTVLVVDDIAENRLLLRDLCERWGFKVLEAAGGDHALDICRTAAPPVAALLVDQFMPGMDGWGLLRRLRQTPALKHLPTLLISASPAQKPADFPPGIDFDVVLGKPLDWQVLACFLCQRLRLVDWANACCPHPAPATAPGTRPVAGAALPANELEHFKRLLDLGRVLRIEEWAQGLAAKNPDTADFAEQVVQHCRAGDLRALEKLAATAVPS